MIQAATAVDTERAPEDLALDTRYQQLVELAPDAILVHDGTQIVLVNAAAVRLAGATSRSQLIGKPIETFLDPPYLKAVQTELTNAVSPTELAPAVRDTFHRLDGTSVEVEVRAAAFMDHGLASAHLVIRDMTERLAAERASRDLDARLEQAQRMETIGALAGGVAHEVNNMMTVIVGYGAMLLDDEDLGTERLAEVRTMVHAAERAGTVTEQLLAFSRKAVHRPQIVNLGDAVRDTTPVIRRILGEDRELVVTANATAPVSVDLGQLEQVIVNLALNARHATPPGGMLAVTTADADLSDGVPAAGGLTIPAGRYATLQVSDNGSGMDATTRERIFEPFFTTKPVGEGTGLGLAAVHGILAQNGGYVTVESAPGEGTAFTLYLPTVAEVTMTSRRKKARLSTDTAHKGGTVLVVDDEDGVRAVIAAILSRSGYNVLEASNGADAIALAERSGAVQLVLTDRTMPGIAGTELSRRMKERWPALPVILMSGYSTEGNGDDRADAADGQLEKPFSPAALLKSVASALARTGAPKGASSEQE